MLMAAMLFPIALRFHIANTTYIYVAVISLLLPTASPVTTNLRSRAKLMAHVCSFLSYYIQRHVGTRIFFNVQNRISYLFLM